MFDASWARSKSSRSSRSSASIIDCELGALLGRHRPQQRLHRGHPLRSAARRCRRASGPRERTGRAWPGSRATSGLAAADPLVEERVEVADHLAVRLEVLRRHARIASHRPCDEVVEDLLAEPLDQRVEPFAGSRLQEVVLLEAADPLADVGGQRVELVEPRPAASGASARRGPSGRGRRPVRAGASSSRRSTPARSSATISSSSRRTSPSTSPSW